MLLFIRVTVLNILDIFGTGVSKNLFVKRLRLLIQTHLPSYLEAVEYDIFSLKSYHIHILIFLTHINL